ncbi:MAG: hypothetical protein AB1762_15125 [Gemmatimonadota bacterium]
MALFPKAIGGEPLQLDDRLISEYPELAHARYRRGGLPPLVGGWFLGIRSVAGITLGHTVWLAPDAHLTPRLLLHELAHVRQWRSVRWFALRYVWESLVRGYASNRFEIEAEAVVRSRLSQVPNA